MAPFKTYHIFRKIWLLIAFSIVLLAIFLSVIRIITPFLTPSRDTLAMWATQALSRPVKFGEVSAHWENLEPIVKFTDVVVFDEQHRQHLLQIDELQVGVNLLTSLFYRQLQPDIIRVSGVKLTVRQDAAGQLHVAGFDATTSGTQNTDQLLSWLFSKQRLSFKNISLDWYDQDNTLLPISQLTFGLGNKGDFHHFWGQAQITQSTPENVNTQGSIRWVVDWRGASRHREKWQFYGYLDAKNIQLAPLLKGRSFAGLRIDHGSMDLEWWGSWRRGEIQRWQTQFDMKDAVVITEKIAHPKGKGKHLAINRATGNVAWQRARDGGWQLAGDDMRLTLNNQAWPVMQFGVSASPALKGVSATQVVQLSYWRPDDLLPLLLESTLLTSEWHDAFAQLQPRGALHDFFVYVDDPSVSIDAVTSHYLALLPFSGSGQVIATLFGNDGFYIPPYNVDTVFIPPFKQAVAIFSLRDIAKSLPPTAQRSNASRFSKRWVIDTKFRDFSVLPWQKNPGFTGFSGHLRIEPTQGAVELLSQHASLDMKSVFRQTIPLDWLTANITWQKNSDKQNWQMQLQDMYVKNSDLQLYANMDLEWPAEQLRPTIYLSAGFQVTNASHKSRYLPISLLKPRLMKWLDDAIVSGQISSGTAILQGKLADFPFDKGTGTFIVDGDVKDTVLRYAADWPVLHHLNANLLFSGRSMTIDVASGMIEKSSLHKVIAHIPYLGKGVDAVLDLKGRVTGTLADGAQFLRSSPLRDDMGGFLAEARFLGPMVVDLNLSIPIEDTHTPNKVSGDVYTRDSEFQLPDWNLSLDHIQGKLHFTENSLSAEGVKSQLFGQPAILDITTKHEANQRITKITLHGNVGVNDLRTHISSPLWSYLSGKTSYRALVQIIKGNETVTFTAPLQGIAVDLPPPFAKKAQEEMLLTVNSILGNKTDPSRIKINYGNRVSGAFTFKKVDKIRRFYSGEVRIGGNDAVFQEQPGLLVTGRLAELPWAVWKPYVMPSKTSKETATPRFQTLLRRIDLQIDRLALLGQVFSSARLQIMRGVGEWIFNLNNVRVSGELRMSDVSSQQWRANFQRFYLESGTASFDQKLTLSDIPRLAFVCHDLRYGNKNFGRVEMDLQPRSSSVLQINHLSAVLPSYQLTASGVWRQRGNRDNTELSGSIISKNLSAMLRSWDLPAAMTSQDAKADFNLNWPSTPHDFQLKTINGDVSLKFKNGSIVDVGTATEAKMNLAKVLNLLSLETLQRRLSLDFSDLTSSGFGFDRLTGSFQLNKGNALTDDTQLSGPVASVALKGRIGLAAEDYDLELKMTPHVTSSLPVVATLTGGPIAGVIALAANKVLGSQVQQMTTRTYRMTGSWQKPIVEPVGGWQQKLLRQL